jgi:hypothetical protein
MQYLIDGHNLIGKMPDISLSDPDDEVQLILRLRSWAAASRKRRVTVYFDGGIPGGKNVHLSTSNVKVIFAAAGRTADGLIIKRINKVKNPAEYTVVSSDLQILNAAAARKLPQIRSEKFALKLGRQWEERLPGPTITDTEPALSEMEINEWLEMFGPVDEQALRRRPSPIPPTRRTPEPEPEAAPETPLPPASSNREDPMMSEKELAEWLDLFGSAPPPEKQSPPSSPPASKPTSQRRRRKKADNPHNLKQDDLNAWHDFLGREE